MSASSHTIFCLWGKPHTPQPKKGPIPNKDFHGICDGIEDGKKKIKQTALSSICSLFKLHVIHIKKEHKILEKINKPVKVTTFPFKHNHTLSTQILIKANMVTFQYWIHPKSCHTMLNLIKEGPNHYLHLRNFLTRFYLSSQAFTAQMMFNFCLKCMELQNKYGSVGNVPQEKANTVFNHSSLESALEHWDTNPIYSQIFKGNGEGPIGSYQ